MGNGACFFVYCCMYRNHNKEILVSMTQVLSLSLMTITVSEAGEVTSAYRCAVVAT